MVLKYLLPHYRVVVFDQCGWGLNTRLKSCPEGMASPENAERWLIEFLVKTIDALDVPQKFYLAGMSMGGYLVQLYASACP